MLFKFYKKIYLISKRYLILTIVEIIIKIIIPFIIILFPKLIIQMIIKNEENIIIIMVFLVIGKYFLNIIKNYLKFEKELLGNEINYKFELELMIKIMELDYEYLEKPEILNMKDKALEGFTIDENSNLSVYNENIVEIISAGLSIIGVIYIVFKIDIYFLIILFIIVILNFFIEKLIANFELKNWEKWIPINRRFRMVYNLMYDLKNGAEIRIYNSKNFFMDKVMLANKDMYKVMSEEAIIVSKYGILTNLLEGIKLFFINWIAIISLLKNTITIADFITYLMAINIFLNGIKKISASVVSMSKNSRYIEEYFKFLEIKNMNKKGLLEPKIEKCTLEFKNVYFKYPGSDKYVLKNISFSIKDNEKISIVGDNGAGKSTVVKLILGFYNPTKGKILFNGIDIRKYNRKRYLKHFATIFQDFNIFPFSIRENIECEKKSNIKKVTEILKILKFYERVLDLENGLETIPIKNYDEFSSEFSLGEKQKIALARAIYRESDIFILDEPTSSMDIKTEIELYKNFEKLTKGKIAIYISHRIASSKFCDKIFVFHNGEIVETGTYEELIEKKGLYNTMYELQRDKFE